MKKAHSETKEHLMEAALEIFTRKGFAGASIREIVSRCGVTKPTLYYYFGNKSSLYRSLLSENFAHFNQEIAEIAGAEAAPETRLVRIARHYLDHCRRFPGNVQLTLMALYRCDTSAPEMDMEGCFRPGLESIAAVIAEGIKAGNFRRDNPLKLVLQLLGVIHTQILVMLKGKGRLPLSTAEEIVNNFIRGIKKTEI